MAVFLSAQDVSIVISRIKTRKSEIRFICTPSFQYSKTGNFIISQMESYCNPLFPIPW
jgi:hypothetical protein